MPRTTRSVPFLACDGIGCDNGQLEDYANPGVTPLGWMHYRGTDPGPEGTDNDRYYCTDCAKKMMDPTPWKTVADDDDPTQRPGRRTHEPELDPSALSTVPGIIVR